MIQVVVMDKRRFINKFKDFQVVSPKQHKDLLDYITETLQNPSNSIIEISKWNKGERL